jgi:hypothetical protein
MCNQSRNLFQPQPIFFLKPRKSEAIKIQDANRSQTVWGIRDLNTGNVSAPVVAGPKISLLDDVWPFEEGARCGWTNLISTAKVAKDQRDDQLALGAAVTCNVAWVGLYVRDERGGFSEECVSANAACLRGRKIDELTRRFAAEWSQKKRIWVGKGMIRMRGVARIGKV